MPNELILIDNTHDAFVCYRFELGQKVFQSEQLPVWVEKFAKSVEQKQELSENLKPDAKDRDRSSLKQKDKSSQELIRKNKKRNSKGKGPKL